MKLFNIILIIFITLTNGIKADSENQFLDILKKGGNLIFIRHAYAPGGGDPDGLRYPQQPDLHRGPLHSHQSLL